MTAFNRTTVLNLMKKDAFPLCGSRFSTRLGPVQQQARNQQARAQQAWERTARLVFEIHGMAPELILAAIPWNLPVPTMVLSWDTFSCQNPFDGWYLPWFSNLSGLKLPGDGTHVEA